MPAKKPASLLNSHMGAAEKARRQQSESAMRPATALPKAPPPQLKGHDTARATWRWLIRTYGDLEAPLVSRLDMDLLIDYCLLTEQAAELEEMRASCMKIFREDGAADKSALLADIVRLDGRLDRKRSLLHTLRQSLYLTPRARAGVAPAAKEEPIDDPFERFLNGGDWQPPV